MRRPAHRPAMFMMAVLLTGTSAAAQEVRSGAPAAGIEFGRVRFQPGIELRDAGLDTNILHETGEALPDSVATLVSHLGASVRLPAVRIETTNAVGFDYFARYRDERSVNRDHRLRVEARAGAVSLFAQGGYLDTRERFNFDLDSRVRRFEKGAALGTALRLTPKTSAGVEARRTQVAFDGSATIDGIQIKPVMQHRLDTETAYLRYSITRLTTLSLRADAEQARFPRSAVRDSDSVRIMPAIEFQPAAFINGAATLGYRTFRPLNNAFPAFSGLVGAADVSIPVAYATRLRIEADRDLQYSYQLTDPTYVLSGIGGSLIHRVTERWELEAGAGREHLVYRALAGSGDGGRLPPPSRVDRRIVYHTAIGYQATSLLRIGLQSEYVRRESDISVRRFEQFRVGAFVQYGVVR